MATATGYTCDVCNAFEVAGKENKRPAWLTLSVPTEHDVRNGHFDICSDKCLLTLARQRHQVNKSTTPQRPRRMHSDDFKKEIVALVQSGTSAAEVADSYDLAHSLVRNWVAKFKDVV